MSRRTFANCWFGLQQYTLIRVVSLIYQECFTLLYNDNVKQMCLEDLTLGSFVRTKQLYVNIHIRIKVEGGRINMFKISKTSGDFILTSPGGASFVDPF